MGNYNIVKLLNAMTIVDVNIVESNSCSALMIACMHGYCSVAEELLERSDCDVNLGEWCSQCQCLLINPLLLLSVQLWLHLPGYCLL